MRSLSSVLIFATLAVFVQGLKDEQCTVSGKVCGNFNGNDKTYDSCDAYLDDVSKASENDLYYLVSVDGGCILDKDINCEDPQCDAPDHPICVRIQYSDVDKTETKGSPCNFMGSIRCVKWRGLFTKKPQEKITLVYNHACP